MIWWPFNLLREANLRELEVVTHQWSGDPSIVEKRYYDGIYES